ncbi:MAG: NGG1p interacting factor NIF3 [Candidatus Gracilibacteria bacterium]|jgi:putative NIF3 family GTP cyclohydrolase 1 type 2
MMTLKQIYDYSLQMAIKRGPRPVKEVEEQLKKLKHEYEKLEEKKKEYFDVESLKNPFLDSRILSGDPNTKLKRVLVGIDIGVGEIMLANELNKSDKKIDAVIAHHPEGRGLIDLTQVMTLQEDIAMLEGVPVNVIEKLMRARIGDLNRGLHAANHFQVPDAAKLLNMPFACFHTFADNQVYWFIKNYITKKNPKYISDIMDALMELPEYQIAKRRGNGPMMFVGDEKARVGKISYSGFTGGTSGSKEVYEKMAHAGVGTILAMHIPEEHRKLCEKYHINVLICGHMASDSLGVNLLMDELEKNGVEIVECAGFMRVSRLKKKMPF